MVAEIPFLAGLVLALSLAAPPGPANAIMASAAARRGFVAGWVTGLGAVAGDFTMFLLMRLGVVHVVAAFPWAQVVLATAGALLMAWFAWATWRAARRPAAAEAEGRGGFWRNYVVILTSPYSYAWWLGVGASLYTEFGWTLVAGFFAGLVVWTALWSWLAHHGARRFSRMQAWIAYGSAVVLAVFAGVLAWFAAQEALRLA